MRHNGDQFATRVLGATSPDELGRAVDALAADLAAVEAEFRTLTSSMVDSVDAIGTHLRLAGGKRIRPTLLLLAARFFGRRDEATFQLGAIIEAVHMATLVHDDVIDHATTRRGRQSTNAIWGNSRCVLAGDWLFMQAFKVALRLRHFAVLDVLIDLTQQMVQGELTQIETLGNIISEQQYLDLISCKTAALFAGCLRLGSLIAGAPSIEQAKLERYGHDVGMAFQIVDDVLDLTASEDVLGKPVASDLREGKVTLPVLHAFESGTRAERCAIETVLKERAFDSVAHADILSILHRHGSIEAAIRLARTYADAASEAIANLNDSESKRALLIVPELVVSRLS